MGARAAAAATSALANFCRVQSTTLFPRFLTRTILVRRQCSPVPPILLPVLLLAFCICRFLRTMLRFLLILVLLLLHLVFALLNLHRILVLVLNLVLLVLLLHVSHHTAFALPIHHHHHLPPVLLPDLDVYPPPSES